MPAPKVQSSEQVGRFLCTPHDHPPKHLLMLTAYLDESGHEGNLVIIAGFMGHDDEWTECAERWRNGLGPQRRLLHMKSLRWSKHGTRKLLATLGAIPHECGLRAVMAVTPVQHYEDLVSGTLAQKLVKGYYLSVIGIIDAILKNVPKDETVKFVFEQQEEYELSTRIILNARNDMTSTGARRVSGVEYIPKDDSILTQPADYLAFALLQGFRDQTSKKYKWCEPILKNKQKAFGIVQDRERLRKTIKATIDQHPELMGDIDHFVRMTK